MAAAFPCCGFFVACKWCVNGTIISTIQILDFIMEIIASNTVQLSEVKKNPALLADFDYCVVTKRNRNLFVAIKPELFNRCFGILETPFITSTNGNINCNDLRKILCGQVGLNYDEDRPISVSISYSQYGNPSSATIDWVGSPARTQTFLSIGEKPMVRFIGEFNIKQHSDRSYLLGELCFNFLKHHGFLNKK